MNNDELQELAAAVKEYVAKATEPLLAQIADLQAKSDALHGRVEAVAHDDAVRHDAALEEICTTDASVAQIREWIAELKAAPPPKDGEPGKDADPELMRLEVARVLPPMVESQRAMLVEHMESGLAHWEKELKAMVPKDGKDAEVDYDRIGKAIEEVVAAIPKPKDGKDAEPIHPDTLELLVVKQVDAAVSKLPVIVKHGIDGKDGLSLEGFDLVLGEDGRTVTMRLIHGETIVEKSVKFPVQIYRGVYKSGAEYEHGDVATWDGSSWHCERDTKAEPGNGTDWKLMVKRGVPGKDGIGKKGDPGIDGKNGRDLTHMAPDGSKY